MGKLKKATYKYKWFAIVGCLTMIANIQFVHGETNSEFLSKGEFLIQNCEAVAKHDNSKDAAAKRNWCLGFLRGTLDMAALVHVVVGEKIFFCIPGSVDESEEAAVLVSYLKDHKDQWHSNHLLLLINAFSEKFPCQQNE